MLHDTGTVDHLMCRLTVMTFKTNAFIKIYTEGLYPTIQKVRLLIQLKNKAGYILHSSAIAVSVR